MAITDVFKAGEPGFGVITDWTELPFLEMTAIAKPQYVVLDDEHREASPEAKERFLSVIQGAGIPALIRVPEFQIGTIGRVFEVGFDGIIIPHVENAAVLDEVMNNVYFPPRGARGIGQARGNKYYSGIDTAGYVNYVNANNWIVAQIESPKGVENAEEIVSHDGVAAIMVGPRDLSTEMGKPGDFFADDVQAQIEKIRDVCKKYNKVLIMPCGTGAFEKYKAKNINHFLVSAGPLYFGGVKNAAKLAMES